MNNTGFGTRRGALAMLALAAMLVAGGCGKGGPDTAPPAVRSATVVTVRPTAVPMTVELPGRLDAYRQAEVRARVAGIVTARTYDEGQEVKQGAVLFRIDSAPLKAARDAAQGALAKAQAAALAATDKRRRYDDLVRDARSASATSPRPSPPIRRRGPRSCPRRPSSPAHSFSSTTRRSLRRSPAARGARS